jgi:hypothetical protein
MMYILYYCILLFFVKKKAKKQAIQYLKIKSIKLFFIYF